ncbi:hypothetical protein M407DRAFT_8392 [Tulasnella calospora MUT 4182]|uniref:Protein kinase domain-containing protein n=1 Tax=Tulasnella calospora MUT 4182 TaxID=1051891 RepID=A0A0C3Q783_9AGAM|nr:hypothetical protein M407DRAFT_8392 [Tulasnella calospora MUT 4182]
MSPELFPFDEEGENQETEQVVHTLHSDMWAFGSVMFEVLTGKVPYRRLRNESSVIKALAERKLPSNPESLDLPGDYLATLLKRCWKLDPASRPSASECLNMLLTESDKVVVKVESTWRNDELIKSDCEHIQEANEAFFSADGTQIALVDDGYMTCIWEPFESRVEERKWTLSVGAVNICDCGALSIVDFIEYGQIQHIRCDDWVDRPDVYRQSIDNTALIGTQGMVSAYSEVGLCI